MLRFGQDKQVKYAPLINDLSRQPMPTPFILEIIIRLCSWGKYKLWVWKFYQYLFRVIFRFYYRSSNIVDMGTYRIEVKRFNGTPRRVVDCKILTNVGFTFSLLFFKKDREEIQTKPSSFRMTDLFIMIIDLIMSDLSQFMDLA